MILHSSEVKKIVKRSLKEDIKYVDLTTSLLKDLLPPTIKAEIICQGRGVIAGLPFARECFLFLSPNVSINQFKKEGDVIKAGEVVMEIDGETAAILSAERTALNFLMRLSGIATATRMLVEQADGKTQILDTRKTTPLFRLPEKYAVKIGGGNNHRMGLYDGILIKDNHKRIVGSLQKLLDYIDKNKPAGYKVEVEVENLKELEEVIKCGSVDVVLLDNFSPNEVKRAVEITPPGVQVEVSGNIDDKNLRDYLIKGVDFISSGFITHSAKAIPFSLEVKDGE